MVGPEVSLSGTYSLPFSVSLVLNIFQKHTLPSILKDINSTVAKRGSVLIGLMTPDGAIWSRYQRAVLMR